MSLGAVKLEIASAVREHPLLRETTFHYPEKRCTPPGFVLSLPDDMDPTVTYGRGSATMVLMGWLVLPLTDMREADNLACRFYDPADMFNLVQAIQDRKYVSCAKVMVDKVRFEPIILGGVTYLGGRNVLNVHGITR